MKRKELWSGLLAGVACCMAFSALADTETVNGVQWTYVVRNGEAWVGGGNASSPAISQSTTGAITIPFALGGYPVTCIGNQAFRSCAGLTNVMLGTRVESIGIQAFSHCNNLSAVTISDSVKSIGNYAFEYCTNLMAVHIHDLAAWCGIKFGESGTTTVGYLNPRATANPLYYARHLYVNDDEVTSIVFPDGIASIGAYQFCNCQGLEEAIIPTSAKEIEESAFSGCTGLQRVFIPQSVTKIGSHAFANCSSLTEAIIPTRVASIGEMTFYGCSGLTDVFIPKSVTEIGNKAFGNCRNLTEIIVPANVKNIGTNAFSGCSSLKTLQVPASWKGTDKLANIEIPSGCTVLYEDEEETGPNPPTAEDLNLSITPPTRNFGTGGGGGAIVVSGNGTWYANTSESWITLNASSGQAGYPVAYTVSATTNVESRTGYIYVSGYVHTVTQDGLGARIDPTSITFEATGGTGMIEVMAPARMGWKAKSNCDWMGVTPTHGIGSGSVKLMVTAYDDVSTRQGTLTVAGETFTVFQYGRRLKLSPTKAEYDYYTHVIPITVDALAITEWTVEPQNSWISVVDGGNGKGSDLVTIAIAENPSWKERTGTVRIGTQMFTVTQNGRTALEFGINPEATTASVEGANGLIAVTATPDLPWSAKSKANWLTVYAATANGAGNGNVAYSAAPNPTLYDRTGSIVVTPGDELVSLKTHTVTQPAAVSALSANGYEFVAAGESCEVSVSVSDIVEWQIDNPNSWLMVVGATNRVGPGMVTLQAVANNTVYPRSGTVTIARKTFRVSQLARGVEVEYDTKLFKTDGGYESISIHPDGQVAWTAVASDPTWITIFQGGEGTGDGEILYIVSPYVGTGEPRTGTITVGDKVVYITQRAYDLSIDPTGAWVAGNNGAGEFGVSAGINDVWTAIVTEPWITLVEGYDAGTGNGVVRFVYTDNDTGKTRVGKIIVAGEVYTLQQRARQMVMISALAERGGTVSGAGSYDLGTEMTLTAIPDSGYAFSYWTGDVESMENPLKLTVDVPKSVTAVFEPLPIAFESVVSDTNGVALAWNNLAWAVNYRLFRGVTSVPSSAEVMAVISNTGDCSYLDETGEMEVEYWYWVEAEGVEDDVMSDPMTGKKKKPVIISPIVYENLRGAENPNPATYQEETMVAFENPGEEEGYTFAGWTPAMITAEMTGTQVVTAAWTANRYRIAYNPNGGSGEMEATECTYDEEAVVASNGFVWAGHRFAGWGTSETSGAVYEEGQVVTNLTAANGGVVTLWAAWNPLVVATPVIEPGDGTVFFEEECEVSITCATEGAEIYYATDGTTPRQTEAFLYGGPFVISNTASIKAVAVLEGVKSEYAAAEITRRIVTLAEALGVPEWEVTTGGEAGWRAIVDASAQNGFAAESGKIAANGESWMETTVEGAGVFQFDWKVECEKDDSGAATWDHLAVSVDGAEAARIDGTTEWARVELSVEGEGAHRVRWTFSKDGYDTEEAEWRDLAWVAGVAWVPEAPPDVFPEVAEDDEVAAALAGVADVRLAERIVTVEEYEAFRAWIETKELEPEAVKDSAHAWPSYLLGVAGQFENEPTIMLGGGAEAGVRGARAVGAGVFEVSVTVKDGDKTVAADAGKVAGLFECTSDLADWTGEAALVPTVVFKSAEGETLLFEVTPGDGAAARAFLRIAE